MFLYVCFGFCLIVVLLFPLPSLPPFIPFVAIVGSTASGLVFGGRPRLWFHWSLGPQELVWNLAPGSMGAGLGPGAAGASLVLRQTNILGW